MEIYMIDIFLRSPVANTLAVIVLMALTTSWFTAILSLIKDIPVQTEKGFFAGLLPAFSLLGVPAALDLLQTKGITFLFAAIVLFIFILNCIIPILKIFRKSSHALITNWYHWSILLSTLGGLAVTGYLTFIESTGAPIVCGPSSGCGDVLSSRYSVLFDFLPLGILGLVGYAGILTGWLILQFGPNSIKGIAALAIWAMSIFGVLFSMYLTFLEPFVIGHTCMWCISSAVLMMLLLLTSTPAAQEAFSSGED
jgi:uncharacterized membrane protein